MQSLNSLLDTLGYALGGFVIIACGIALLILAVLGLLLPYFVYALKLRADAILAQLESHTELLSELCDTSSTTAECLQRRAAPLPPSPIAIAPVPSSSAPAPLPTQDREPSRLAALARLNRQQFHHRSAAD